MGFSGAWGSVTKSTCSKLGRIWTDSAGPFPGQKIVAFVVLLFVVAVVAVVGVVVIVVVVDVATAVGRRLLGWLQLQLGQRGQKKEERASPIILVL